MTIASSIRNSLRIVLLALALAGGSVSAQSAAVKSNSRMATRTELESAAAELDQLAASTAYGERIRGDARRQATAIRRRLTEGDFRPGDRLVLRIDGQLTVNDTLTVLDGVRIAVPSFRQVSLSGVLRSELETKLRAELTEVVRNATVTARPLVRLAVLGSVTRPGYVTVPSETTVDGLLMMAGGPLTGAAVNEMTLTRADTVLFGAGQTRGALVDGLTVGQLDLSDGDALEVPPPKAPWDRNAVLQIVGVVFSLLSLVTITQQLRR